jgi:uncharacterized membrane protein YidH (DUF202 family)
MTANSAARERTWLGQRRTALGLLVNAALLYRLPPVGYVSATIVLLCALIGLGAASLSSLRIPLIGRTAPPVAASTLAVLIASILDLVTIVTARR